MAVDSRFPMAGRHPPVVSEGRFCGGKRSRRHRSRVDADKKAFYRLQSVWAARRKNRFMASPLQRL